MNLAPRGVASNATSAAIAMTAALRTLEAAGVYPPAVWVAHGRGRFDATAAWDHGIALVRVEGMEADNAARAVADAVNVRVVRSASDLGRLGPSRGDGARLGARHELGLWPDERVAVVLRADRDVDALAVRLAAFDERLVAERDVPQRLVLADLLDHGPRLSEPMVAAILHPLVLVELRRDTATLDLLRLAADEIVEG
ncbi:MAG TPA: hypothetical protein VGQ89_01755 [Candidatus Limnocylindrales bacterium]|nr:hypothetical protein [Candidatus Limnocylindrales bacterium]